MKTEIKMTCLNPIGKHSAYFNAMAVGTGGTNISSHHSASIPRFAALSEKLYPVNPATLTAQDFLQRLKDSGLGLEALVRASLNERNLINQSAVSEVYRCNHPLFKDRYVLHMSANNKAPAARDDFKFISQQVTFLPEFNISQSIGEIHYSRGKIKVLRKVPGLPSGYKHKLLEWMRDINWKKRQIVDEITAEQQERLNRIMIATAERVAQMPQTAFNQLAQLFSIIAKRTTYRVDTFNPNNLLVCRRFGTFGLVDVHRDNDPEFSQSGLVGMLELLLNQNIIQALESEQFTPDQLEKLQPLLQTIIEKSILAAEQTDIALPRSPKPLELIQWYFLLSGLQPDDWTKSHQTILQARRTRQASP